MIIIIKKVTKKNMNIYGKEMIDIRYKIRE